MKILFSIIAFASFSGLTGSFLFCQSCSRASVDAENANKISKVGVVSSPLPTTDIRKWIAPTFLGLELGKSKEKDVLRLFGKPDDEYPNRDDDKVYEKSAEDEVVLDYRTLKEANGHVVVIVGKKSRVVKAISLYPNEQISLDEAISTHGQDFFQHESWESYCVKDGRTPGTVDKNMTYPFILVYPNLGLAIDIRNYGKGIYVGRIDYLMECN